MPMRCRDTGLTAAAFGDPTWVLCPRCGGAARSAPDEAGERRRLVCRRCSFTADRPLAPASLIGRSDTDPHFSLPLFLAVEVGRHKLWAFNVAHLDALARWVEAPLRERAAAYPVLRNRTMMSRLPRWMTAAAARPRILRALVKLKVRATMEGLSCGPGQV